MLAPVDLADDRGDVADLVVLGGGADVERLVMHGFGRRLHQHTECTRDILDVHQRAPRRTVAFQEHLAGGQREPGEVVDHKVTAETLGGAIRRGVAQIGRREIVVGHGGKVLLDEDL